MKNIYHKKQKHEFCIIQKYKKDEAKLHKSSKYLKYKVLFSLLVYLIFIISLKAHEGSFKFAIIGDFGDYKEKSVPVSMLVKSWNPDMIITTGDNNYPCGSKETIDDNVGSLYSSYIFPYKGKYVPPTIQQNRFHPCLGNHDYDTDGGNPYLNYFSLPGNSRYYDFIKENVHFFALSSDHREPDGTELESKQAIWLKTRLEQSQSLWKIVYFHHPVYSSANNFYSKNGERTINFPFTEWGASMILNGHVHVYERFHIKGVPYIINGLGGKKPYDFCDPNPESLVRYNGDNGAMLAEVKNDKIVFKFINIANQTIDEFTISKQ